MKLIHFAVFILAIQNSFCQKLPDDFEKQPDGITIHYFDYTDQSNLIRNEVFLGKELKFKFPERNNYKRISILDNTSEIELIEKYLTFGLIENLTKCSSEKDCGDTFNGYFLMIKKGKEIKFITIDVDCMTETVCGNEALSKIIEAY